MTISLTFAGTSDNDKITCWRSRRALRLWRFRRGILCFPLIRLIGSNRPNRRRPCIDFKHNFCISWWIFIGRLLWRTVVTEGLKLWVVCHVGFAEGHHRIAICTVMTKTCGEHTSNGRYWVIEHSWPHDCHFFGEKTDSSDKISAWTCVVYLVLVACFMYVWEPYNNY